LTDLFMTGATPDEVWPLIRDYHYSKRMPSATRHTFAWRRDGGLFGDFGEPLAAALYGNPVQMNWPQDALELQRLVRRDDFDGILSTFLSWTLRWLREHTDVPFVISYADTREGHLGTIYQATNWKLVQSKAVSIDFFLLPDGSRKHPRQVNRELGSCSLPFVAERRPDWVPVKGKPKHLYVFPLRQRLNAVMRRFNWQELPYPKFATCPADEPVPPGVSLVQPKEVAPL
jgi:hypothetical protein